MDRYILDVLPQKKKSQKKQTAQLLWWKEQLGSYLLADITPALIGEKRDELQRGITYRGTQRSPATVVRYLSALSHALSIAVKEWGWMEDSPMRKVSKPRDAVEAKLAAQMAVLHVYAIKSIKRSGDADMLCHIEAMANLGIKLMRVHNETIEAFNRYRRGGEQKVTVTHAVLANQAVVNNHYGEGASPQKRGDTPCPQGNAEQKQEQMSIGHAGNLPCQMGDADFMVEKAVERKLSRVSRKSNR